MFGSLGMQEILLILFILLLLFGAKRLPELGQSLGKGIREFKRGVTEIKGEIEREEPEPQKELPRQDKRPVE